MNLLETYEGWLQELRYVEKKGENTVRTYRSGLDQLKKFLVERGITPDHGPAELTPIVFVNFYSWLGSQEFGKATLMVYINAIRSYVKYLVIHSLVEFTYNQATQIQAASERVASGRHKHLPKVPPKGSVDMMLQAVGKLESKTPVFERNVAIIWFLYSTGVRVEELTKLKIEDLDMTERWVRVRHGKGDKERTVVFDVNAQGALEKYFYVRGSRRQQDPVFARHDQGAGDKMKHLSTNSVRDIVRRVSIEAGLDEGVFTPHKFRGQFLTDMVRKEGIAIAAQAAGHSDWNTTKGYLNLYPDDLKKSHENVFGNGKE